MEAHLRLLSDASAGTSARTGAERTESREAGEAEEEVIQMRMEEELGPVSHLIAGLHELELDVSDQSSVAGTIAEWALDTLRNEGWILSLIPAPSPASTAAPTMGGMRMEEWGTQQEESKPEQAEENGRRTVRTRHMSVPARGKRWF